MPKRKRPDSATHSGKRVCLSLESSRPKPCRRSARLQKIEPQKYARRVDELCQLPSPTASNADTANGGKRKQAAPETIVLEDQSYPKRRKQSQPDVGRTSTEPYDPIKHWVYTKYWPKDLWQIGFKMSNTPTSKRRSEYSSSHRSQTVERMAVHGVFMESSHLIQKPSRDLCDEYLKGDRKAVKTSVFSSRDFEEVLNRVRNLNEARIQRDVTPWVVPSVETLFFRGDFQLDWVGEELNAEWIRCAAMGSTTPKPDYAAGLLRCAFTEEEMQKLENHASPTQPCRFTPNLCFPFLVCEAKTGEKGINKADRQNIHSASIAVRAIIMLYREAFGTTDPSRVHSLYGQVLVFTVSHDNDRVFLYSHFAVTDSSLPSGLKFYRHPIALYSLTTSGGADRLKAYNFVRNVYDRFAPAHRQRIRDALAHIPNPSERTGLSFAASDISLDQPDSQQDPFRRPGAPSSTSQ
ncbi:hypothetical protein MMC13_005416 [Lambiella insularis]|nr:hypothetical protein [Lambiella insularis]